MMTSAALAPARLAFVEASVHADVVESARYGFIEAIGDQATVETFSVPGAFELPLHVRMIAESGRFDAVVAAGFVVDGGIYRHEFVADAVISGLMAVQLDVGVPVFSSVLTPQLFHETEEHRAFFKAHMVGKGEEVANACLSMLRSRSEFAGSLNR